MKKRNGGIYVWMFWLLGVVSLASCVEEVPDNRVAGMVQVMGRVTTFSERDVASRGLKTNEESKISNMTLFIFDDKDVCINCQHVNSSNPVFVVDRQALKEATNNTLTACKLYILSNVFTDLSADTWKNKTLTNLLDYAVTSTNIVIPDAGFPMLGHLDDVDLTPGATLPSDILEIPLKALYAKIVFSVKVNPDQVTDEYISSFQLSSWEVHNVPSGVRLGESVGQTAYSNSVNDSYESRTVTGVNPVSGSNELNFYFYMPEHKVEPFISADEYEYPFDTIAHPEYKEYRQRYKPELVKGEGYTGKPTFVRMKGVYSDHQGHRKSVQYDVYLGNDNYSNFQIERNCQYNNRVTIKGLTNSNQADSLSVSFDHRVEITDVPMFTVWMERETQLDSHFEVRPIRIKLDEDFPANGKVEVSVLDASSNDWIRLEKNSKSSTEHCSNGKRLYFTTNLVKETLADNISCEITSNNDNCVWVYVDENTETLSDTSDAAIEAQKKKMRKATIQIAYYADGQTLTSKDVYTFSQRYLYPVKSTSRTNDDGSPYIYYIEYFEEYLHDFDSDNHFGLTDYEGMAWGLDSLQISSQYQAAMADETSGLINLLKIINIDVVELVNNIVKDISPKYDFYLTVDKNDKELSDYITIRDYSGYDFSQEIMAIAKSNDKLSKGTLDVNPLSAVEYCYNKNQRNTDGSITVGDEHWYLPSIDEIEDIVMSAYADFDVFQNKYYWSSQPSYIFNEFTADVQMNIFGWNSVGKGTGSYYNDDIERARATKVLYENGKYTPAKSGVLTASGHQTFVYKVGNSTTKGDYTPYSEPDREIGNKSRTEKCRIRAVYKP